jgi:predicted XRE-type DNA-binding protein
LCYLGNYTTLSAAVFNTTLCATSGKKIGGDSGYVVLSNVWLLRSAGSLANAGLEQARAIIAAKIINILDERKLSTRDAEKQTGVSHSEFSHIRNTQLRRFTLDRMITILGKLDEDVEVNVTFRPRQHGEDRPHLL